MSVRKKLKYLSNKQCRGVEEIYRIFVDHLTLPDPITQRYMLALASLRIFDGSFLWLWLAMKASQELNSVACNVELSDLAV